MTRIKQLYIWLVYTVLLLALALKATIICADSTMLLKLHYSYCVDYDGNIETVDLFAQSHSAASVEVNSQHDVIYSPIQGERVEEQRSIALAVPKVPKQYYPIPRICSHTGIFLCLRL